jgi:acyl carrier protein
MKQEVENRVIEIIRNISMIETVMPHHEFVQDLGMDSLDLTEAIMQIESAFAIAIPDNDVENIKTVEQLTDYVYEQKKI